MSHDHKIITLKGQQEVSITKLDGSTDTVTVKQLPARLMLDYAKALEDEVSMIKLATGKDDEFCDSLSIESHELLVTTVEAVNGDFFQRWFERKKARAERIAPGAFEKALAKI